MMPSPDPPRDSTNTCSDHQGTTSSNPCCQQSHTMKKLTSLILAALTKTVDKPREAPPQLRTHLSKFKIRFPSFSATLALPLTQLRCSCSIVVVVLRSAATGRFVKTNLAAWLSLVFAFFLH